MWRDIVLGMILICNLIILDELMQQFKRAISNYRFNKRMEAWNKRMNLVKKTIRIIEYDKRDKRGLA